MANSVDPDQTAPIGSVCSGSTLFASIHNSSVLLGNLADDIFRRIFLLGGLRVKHVFATSIFSQAMHSHTPKGIRNAILKSINRLNISPILSTIGPTAKRQANDASLAGR